MPGKRKTQRDYEIYEFLKEGFSKHLQKKYLFQQVREKLADLSDYSINRIYERYHDKAKVKELSDKIAELRQENEILKKRKGFFNTIVF